MTKAPACITYAGECYAQRTNIFRIFAEKYKGANIGGHPTYGWLAATADIRINYWNHINRLT